MAPTKGNDQALLVDEVIWNADTAELTTAIAVSELETPNLAMTANEYSPNLPDWTIEHSGYMTGVAADEIEAEMSARRGTTGSTVAHLFTRSTTNSPAYVLPSAGLFGQGWGAPVADVLTVSGTWRNDDGQGYRGALVTYNTTVTATGDGTSIDLGSAGSSGGVAYLFVHTIDTDISGTATDASFKIQSSSDNSSFADEGTFTVGATGAFSATLSGTVNRYVRLNTADLGGATSFTVTLIACVADVTY